MTDDQAWRDNLQFRLGEMSAKTEQAQKSAEKFQASLDQHARTITVDHAALRAELLTEIRSNRVAAHAPIFDWRWIFGIGVFMAGSLVTIGFLAGMAWKPANTASVAEKVMTP